MEKIWTWTVFFHNSIARLLLFQPILNAHKERIESSATQSWTAMKNASEENVTDMEKSGRPSCSLMLKESHYRKSRKRYNREEIGSSHAWTWSDKSTSQAISTHGPVSFCQRHQFQDTRCTRWRRCCAFHTSKATDFLVTGFSIIKLDDLHV